MLPVGPSSQVTSWPTRGSPWDVGDAWPKAEPKDERGAWQGLLTYASQEQNQQPSQQQAAGPHGIEIKPGLAQQR